MPSVITTFTLYFPVDAMAKDFVCVMEYPLIFFVLDSPLTYLPVELLYFCNVIVEVISFTLVVAEAVTLATALVSEVLENVIL